MNISGVLLHARPGHLDRVCDDLRGVRGAEVHAATADGRIVATLETPDDAGMAQALSALSLMPGVMSASLVYAHCEELPEPSSSAEECQS